MDWTGVIERATYDNVMQSIHGGPLTQPQLLVRLDTRIRNPERAQYDNIMDSLPKRPLWPR
jgi:hypothetical protein